MEIRVQKTKMRGKALCMLPGGGLLCYRRGKCVLYARDEEKAIAAFPLPIPAWKRLLCRLRLVERGMHLEARWAVPTEDNAVLLQFGGGIWRLNWETGELTREQVPVKGKPLSICPVRNVEGFPDGFLVGDYRMKRDGAPVSIYHRDAKTGIWRCCHRFPAGAVRHIHGFCPDSGGKCVYILTGDEDAESGIWIARNDFQEVEPFLVGRQQYRTCQMVTASNGQFYLTDAPSEQNCLYRIENGRAQAVSAIPGTCIYGTSAPWGGIYSTACEPDAHGSSWLQKLLTNRPGAGADGRNIQVFALEDGKIHSLAGFRHDGLPLRLFQYASASFTQLDNDVCYFSPVCVRGADMKIFKVTVSRI